MFKKNNKNDIISLMELYRFISVFLTVFIYMVHGVLKNYAVPIMIFLAFCVIAFAFLMDYLYKKSYEIRLRLHLLLIMEIIGISALILFTGGLDSPFIWCFLNPLLVISYHISSRQKYFYLVISFLLLCGIGYYVEDAMEIREYLLLNSNIILSFILLLILVNILFNYSLQIIRKQEELRVANEALENYNARIKGMIHDILYMYEAVQTFPDHRGNTGIIQIILDFAGRASPECNAFFVPNVSGDTDSLISSKAVGQDIRNTLMKKIEMVNTDISESHVAAYLLEAGPMALFSKVSNIKNYGIIGLLVPEAEYIRGKNEYEASLLMISQLGSTFFEKIETETVDCELAVANEQDRIADDIHDSVIQRLFATSCFAYDTLKKWEQITDNKKREQMTLITETIQSSLKDLRSTIYNLSSKKHQIDLFKESVYSYLLEMENLSEVKISPDITGEPDRLSLSAKKALYRIIAECTGNAIKHAKCKNIWVALHIGDVQTDLSIRDDGIGLDLAKAEHEKNGLGLYNIRSLVRVFNGSVNIIADSGTGTTYDIVFMNTDILKKPEEE